MGDLTYPLPTALTRALARTLQYPPSTAGGGGGGFNPVASNLRFTGGTLTETGTGPFNYNGTDGAANTASAQFLSTGEFSVECTVTLGGSSVSLCLSTVTNATDFSTCTYGITYVPGSSYLVVSNNSFGLAANAIAPIGQAGDKMRIRKVGVGATAQVVAEVIQVGTGTVFQIFVFPTLATGTYNVCLIIFGTGAVQSVILRTGQSQARWPYSTYNVIAIGDSIEDNLKLWSPVYAPMLGSGAVFNSAAVAGYRLTDMLTNIGTAMAFYNAGKTNWGYLNGGSNDLFADGVAFGTALTRLTNLTAAIKSGRTIKLAYNSVHARAGGVAGVQATIDARNAEILLFNAAVKANPALYGVDLYVEQRTGIYALPGPWLQAQFDAVNAVAPYQEPTFPNEIHQDSYGQSLVAQVRTAAIGTSL